MTQHEKIDFFDITSVAIIWASEQSWKIGNDLLKNLKDFQWEKMWVNPKGGSFDGIVFYPSITELPIIPDIAVITIPAKLVVDSLEECGKKWIKRVIIISAGFKETGNIAWEQAIKDIAKRYSMRVLWPNCLGYIDAHKNLNLSFWGKQVCTGNIAMVSQSGAMAVALTDWANARKLGFSKLISMGNKSDINENDLLENLANDPETAVIAIYLESLEDGKRFYEITRTLTKKKPIILVKSWLSQRGKVAASSHTWALSWENKVLETAFRDAWIHTTSSLENFFLWAEAFSKTVNQEIPDSLAIITNAGWPGVMATDHCEFYHVPLEDFTSEEQTLLRTGMPESASMRNPLDIIGDATSVRYNQILENLSKLKKKVGVLILLTPQTVTDVDVIVDGIIAWEKAHPWFFLMTSCMWAASIEQGRITLKQHGILDYDYPRKWIIVLSELIKQKGWCQIPIEEPVLLTAPSPSIIDELREKLQRETTLCSAGVITEIFHAFHISFLEDKLAQSTHDVERIWNESNNKLVAKITSKDIAHKTDCGWVVVGIATLVDALEAYESILENAKKIHPEAEITWVTFQEMLPKSKEIFIGMKRDVSFGDILIIGMGGIYVNIYEDVSMKISPVSRNEIRKMLESLKWYPILRGARWEIGIDFDALIDMVYQLMSVFTAFPEIKEIDINPAFANEHGSIIVDAKFYL
jgi:acetyl coenzyme A synthetase (ADP forming)-like protein